MGSFASRPGDPVVGMLIDGRYRVTGVIARGGMATVYRADDTRLDRVVALKVMHRSFADDPGFVARFEREARAAAKLNHPNVVGVFDQGSQDSLVWLAMDYVPGFALRDVIKAHAPLDPDRALGVIEQILSGLGAAHAAGFVHRDIKPENVLMTPEGTMKIADFGLARALIDDDPSTATKGVLIGTVAYLAPEQVESGHADERSDIYATGIVLYELLTGAVPFDGPTPLSVAYRHVNDDVPPPSSRVTGIPPDVDALVLRATTRSPDQRFPSAAEFLVAAQSVDVDEVAGEAGGADGMVASASASASATTAVVAGEPGATGDRHESPDPADDWSQIAAMASTATFTPPSTAPGVSVRPSPGLDDTNVIQTSADTASVPSGRSMTSDTSVSQTPAHRNPDTSVIQTSADTAATDVLRSDLAGYTNIDPSALGQTAAIHPQGATPLTPVTRRPPASAEQGAPGDSDVPTVSRFGRTKLAIFLLALVALMAAGGWWLGMRHNASSVQGTATPAAATAQPATAHLISTNDSA